MKMHVEIDVTPDEARQFLGLPDVKPMQEAVMAQVQAHMLEAADRLSPEGVLKSWLSLVPQGAGQIADLFGRFFPAAFGAAPEGTNGQAGGTFGSQQPGRPKGS